MRLTGREIVRLCGVAVLVGGLAAALALLFVPLGLEVSGTTVGYCGPGATSDNAAQVRLDPGIVNTGGSPGQSVPAAEQQQLEQFCIGEADTKLVEAAATAAVALLLGLPMISRGSRQSARSASSGSGEPPSLSSSGTAGSTVRK
ncbi:MAG TPA: hypothetical protein VMV92_23350 [Streptosporangiaceae bacterium]|nr:hypothetical protein [Streptosporangiaceae bacterium]